MNQVATPFFAVAGAELSVETAFGALAAILFTAIVVSLLLHRFKQSILVGYFICGVIIGPSGLKLVNDPARIQLLSEFGVALLMFNLGIEFSLSELRYLRRTALIGGTVQMLLSSVALGAGAYLLGMPPVGAVFFGLITGLSSTAVVLRVFQDPSSGTSPASRIAIGVSVFQDILAVLLMILLPAAAKADGSSTLGIALVLAALKAVAFLGVGFLLSRYAVPQLLNMVSSTKSRELFTLMVLALCVGIAYLSHFFGLSLALGAFMAGLIVSETVFSHKILADILPFKDFFLTLFFVSIGMLIDVSYFVAHWPVLIAATVLVLLLKTVAAFFGGIAAGFSVRPSVGAGIGLSSIGEFSFVLLGAALAYGMIGKEMHQGVLVCATLTMSSTPILMKLAVPISRFLESHSVLQKHQTPTSSEGARRVSQLQDHIIICGYGAIGENLNRVCTKLGLPTLVIDLNAETIRGLVKQGQLCLFADVTQSETLELACLSKARILALTIPSFANARTATKLAAELNPNIQIVCRARFPQEVEPLRKLGVQAVINEELETSFEIIRRSLQLCERPLEEIDDCLRQIRYEFGVEE